MATSRRDQLSRRALLKAGLAVFAGAVMLPILGARTASAAGKASQESMKYQDQPKDGQKCIDCTQYVAGPKPDAMGQCKVVEGEISPEGWCIAFAPKSS